MRLLSVLILALLTPLAAFAAAPRGFTAEDLVMMKRLSDVQVSPDERRAAFVLRETDRAANKGLTDLFLLDLADRKAPAVRLAASPANDSNPRWSPDGKALYFLSARGGTGQVWRVNADGGALTQVTSLPVAVSGFALSPAGNRLILWASVRRDCADLACTARHVAEAVQSRTSAMTFDRLFARHWDSWDDGLQNHLFSQPLDATGKVTGAPVPLTTSLDGDVPSKPMGGAEEIGISPDGRTVYFALRQARGSEAWSTNLDIWSVAADGRGRPVNLTAANEATDTAPLVSPDGRALAYLAMSKPGFEADRHRVMLRDIASGRTRELAPLWDRSADSLAFTRDGRALLARAQHLGTMAVFRIDLASGQVQQLTAGGTVGEVTPLESGALIVYHDLQSPADLYRIGARGGSKTRLTAVNDERMAAIDMGDAEQFSFAGWNGETVYGWMIKPAGFDARKRYPVAFLIHGGPQASFSDQFHYRWNSQVYAGAGYAVVMIDFHGSTGYGQAFTDSISGDWGGKPLEDLRKGWQAALAQYRFLDGERACALGGSYGGYMVAWMASQWPDAFKCHVNHAGIFDNRSMYYSTEELWFPEWEHGGPQFKAPQAYELHNPVNHVTAWKTPTLVIHGLKDYRVPYAQGLSIFTALQRQGVPSRLLVFPDENHWVLKPANSVKWHEEVLAWLDRWLKA